MADESLAPEKQEVAAVPEAEQAAGSTRVEKPVVAHKGKDIAKPEKGSLPPPGKEAWKDVHTHETILCVQAAQF